MYHFFFLNDRQKLRKMSKLPPLVIFNNMQKKISNLIFDNSLSLFAAHCCFAATHSFCEVLGRHEEYLNVISSVS